MGGGPISPSSKPIPNAPLTLRRATIDSDGSIPGRHCFRDRTLQVPTCQELKISRGTSMGLKWLNQVLCIASCLAVVISRGFLAWLSVED
ncbi:hypothetical protein FOC1_g10009164 [Fusarium oxysporum f. sp. cubense race 1]|uniref:Uncharacterized protein n=1 Tax=Fusarium oxysporum f. sp. cubense (strain race 1) TaxID=1229664 RepID=N4TKS9_FUSC1|nr:hypothetical protein FOC1_g10009164 [Fusarium oxysporum f. sp. cubense race 1]